MGTISSRMLLAAATILLLAACGPKTMPKEAKGPPPPFGSHLHGLWSGKASKSPQGEQPYSLLFTPAGNDVIAETPPTLGDEILPPGAYQKFRFKDGAAGTTLEYTTAMGGPEMLQGTLELVADRSDSTKRAFCEPGACRMELRWESTGPNALSLQVYMDGKLHADIALSFEGDQ